MGNCMRHRTECWSYHLNTKKYPYYQCVTLVIPKIYLIFTMFSCGIFFLFVFLSFFHFVCYKFMDVCTCLCMCVEARVWHQVPSSISLYLFFWDGTSHGTWSSQFVLGGRWRQKAPVEFLKQIKKTSVSVNSAIGDETAPQLSNKTLFLKMKWNCFDLLILGYYYI